MSILAVNEWLWLALMVVLAVLASVFRWRWLWVFVAAAVCVALMLAFYPAGWRLQAALYSASTLLAAVFYLRYFRVPPAANATQKIQRRPHRLVGMRGSLLAATTAGRSRMQLRDAIWPVQSDEKLPRGALVEVMGFSGKVLDVAPIDLSTLPR